MPKAWRYFLYFYEIWCNFDLPNRRNWVKIFVIFRRDNQVGSGSGFLYVCIITLIYFLDPTLMSLH
jgi:hypothetical protein